MTIKRNTLSCALFLLFSDMAIAQGINKIEGFVYDARTHTPIAQAHVGIASKGTGTLTNADGGFTFKYPSINQKESLTASMLGFLNTSKPLENWEADTLWLEPAPSIALDTAFTHHANAKKLVADALFRVKANANLNAYMLNGFYQETLWQDSLFVRIDEALFKTEKNPTTPNKIPDDFMAEKLKLVKGRHYEKEDYTANLTNFGFGNGAAIVSHSIEIALPEYLEGRNFEDYEYHLDSLLTHHNNRPVWVFHFGPAANRKIKAAREGEIFVDTLSRAIVKIEYSFTPEGMKDVVKSTFKGVFGGLKTEVRKVYGSYSYRGFQGKNYLQDAQLILAAELKRGKDFTAFCDLRLLWATTEVLLKFAPPIATDDIWEGIDNFPSGGSRYDDSLWGNFNYLKPTSAMREIVKK